MIKTKQNNGCLIFCKEDKDKTNQKGCLIFCKEDINKTKQRLL